MPLYNSLSLDNVSERWGTTGITNGPGATGIQNTSGEAQRELIKRVVFPVVIVAREKSEELYTLGRLSRPRKYSNGASGWIVP